MGSVFGGIAENHYLCNMNNKPEHQEKQIVYVDMDNVLVDFPSAVDRLPQETFEKYKGHYDEVPGIFATMEPIKGALEAYRYLAEHFDVYILSTAPWRNPSAWSDKLLWVQHYLGDVAYKRLILTHHKDLNRGDYLIDDRTRNGADQFQGKLIQFGTETFPDWAAVVRYFETVVWLQQIELPLSDEDYVALREEELRTNGEVWKLASKELKDSFASLMVKYFDQYYGPNDAEWWDIVIPGEWFPPQTEKYKDYPSYKQTGRVQGVSTL